MKPGPAPGTSFAYWGPEIRIGDAAAGADRRQRPRRPTPRSLSFSFDKDGTEIPIVFIQNALTKAPIPIPIPRQIPFHAAARARSRRCRRRSPGCTTPRSSSRSRRWCAASPMRRSTPTPCRGTGTLDVLRYGRVLQARRAGRRARRRRRLRRGALRRQRDARPDARQLQAELHAEAQRPAAHAEPRCRHDRRPIYGKYRGTVVNNVDPMMIGRIQAIVPDVSDDRADQLGDALLPGGRHPDRHVRACR